MKKQIPANKRANRPLKTAEIVQGAATTSGIFIDHNLEREMTYLLARAGIRMGQSFSREIKKFGVSLSEWRVCAALHHKPHQRLAELAEHTSAEPSTLSRTVEAMVSRGLLIRDRSGDDARALALRLTNEGMDVTQRIIPLAQLYERVALAGITPAQAKMLRDMLRLMYQNIATLDQQKPSS